MSPILVSACLLGDAVRYDATDKRCLHPRLAEWIAQGRVVGICPELAAGLGVPRAPNEIEGGAGGLAVLAGQESLLQEFFECAWSHRVRLRGCGASSIRP